MKFTAKFVNRINPIVNYTIVCHLKKKDCTSKRIRCAWEKFASIFASNRNDVLQKHVVPSLKCWYDLQSFKKHST